MAKKKTGIVATVVSVLWVVGWFIADQTFGAKDSNASNGYYQQASVHQASNPCMQAKKGRASKQNYSDFPVQVCRLEYLPINQENKISPSLISKYNLSTCRVTSVHDGDTVHCQVTSNRQVLKVRLLGIDAPETKQTYGQQAGNTLRNLVQGKTVAIFVTGRDVYNRYLGTLYLPQGGSYLNVNQYMVQTGNAWVYNYSNKSSQMFKAYTAFSQQAQRQGLGLWNSSLYPRGKGPVEPKNWRNN